MKSKLRVFLMYHRNHPCYCVPRCRRHYRLQRQGNTNIYFCVLDSHGIRPLGPAIYGHVTVCISRWSPSASLKVLRLSIATKRMATQNILVQDLQEVETLGT